MLGVETGGAGDVTVGNESYVPVNPCFLIAGAMFSLFSLNIILSESFWSLLASSSESKVMNPYPLDIPARSTTILTCLTIPYCENKSQSSSSVVVAVIPPTNTLLGTTVPYLGALLLTAA
uniref:Uncharacterized protein n=1 Tax=Cacopsylla melanoneura TaxID=428564 RepID=A0A8D8LS39_9HEMI